MSLTFKPLDSVMNSTYQRLQSGNFYDNNLKLYSKEFLQKVLQYFESKEKYEECAILINLINQRYNHDNLSNFKEIKSI